MTSYMTMHETTRPVDLAIAQLSDRHLQAIGTVAIRWAELEATLCELVWDLANLTRLSGYSITTHLNERTLVDMCKTLIDLLVKGPEPALAEELHIHLGVILNTVYPKRNKMIHSKWRQSGIGGKSQIVPVKARGKLIIGPETDYSADEIFAIADEIVGANNKLCDLRDRLNRVHAKWLHVRKS